MKKIGLVIVEKEDGSSEKLTAADWEAVNINERVGLLLGGKVHFHTPEGDVIPVSEVMEILKKQREGTT